MGQYPGICVRNMHAVRTQCNNCPKHVILILAVSSVLELWLCSLNVKSRAVTWRFCEGSQVLRGSLTLPWPYFRWFFVFKPTPVYAAALLYGIVLSPAFFSSKFHLPLCNAVLFPV